MDPIEGPSPSSNGGWFTRYHEAAEFDYHGSRVFRLHLRFPPGCFEYLDVLLAVSVAVAVVVLPKTLTFDVDHIELCLRADGAFRLGRSWTATSTGRNGKAKPQSPSASAKATPISPSSRSATGDSR